MRKIRIGAGPLVALMLFVTGTGFAVAAYVAQIEPAVELKTNLPLARI